MTPSFQVPPWLKPYVGALFGVASVLVALLLFETSFLHETLGTDLAQGLELKGYDALVRSRGQKVQRTDVILVRIDENTVKKMGYPLPHGQLGAVMAALSNFGAKAVALDLIVGETKNPSGEDSLQNAMMVEFLAQSQGIFQSIAPFIPPARVSRKDVDTSGYSVLGRFGIPAPRVSSFPRAPYVDSYPFPELAKVSTSVGHIVIVPDSLDGVIRSVPLFIEWGNKLFPSLGLSLALHEMKIDPSQIRVEENERGSLVHIGNQSIQTGPIGDVLISYQGPSKIFPSVSMYDILEAVQTRNEQFLSRFKGKVCIIGPTDRGLGDYYPLPTGETAPGYVAHANVYAMIMTNDFIYPANQWIQFFLLLLVTISMGTVAHRQKMRTGTLILLGLIVMYILFAYIAFAHMNTWYRLVEPLFATVFCFISTVSYRAATEGRQRKMITNMFERYVDSAVVQQLINNPAMLKLGGRNSEITLLFSDIKGFTTISEKLGPDALVKLLNIYLTEMTNVVMRNRGTVDKFIGDAIMAFWGAPLPDDDAPFNACKAALEMQERLQKLHSKWAKYGNIQIHQRVGINTGDCIIGNMGSESKFNYTAMGDPVNIASRLEGVNKQYGTEIMISQMTYVKVAKRVVAREVDKVIVVGKTEPVTIYELIGLADRPLAEPTRNFLEIYHEGLKAYRDRKWDEVVAYMEHAMTFKADDPVCKLYIERMRLFQIHPPEADWNGVFVLHSK